MSTIHDFSRTSIVLVTGANGHVAQHIVAQLLSRPAANRPRVRATVRSSSSANALQSTFATHTADGSLEVVLVADLTSPAAFTTALEGVTHITHVASPLVVMPSDVERDLLIPAIQGTTSLLKAAAACPTVEAVVVTSSLAAVFDTRKGPREGYTYTSRDWLPLSYEEAADPDLDLGKWPERYRPFVTYCASKKLAEQAAWDFYRETKPKWRLATICPGYIAGPYVLPLRDGAKGVSVSVDLVWRTVTSKPGESLTPLDFVNWIDVRDVADVHIRALISEGAKGKRLIAGPLRVTYSDMAKVVQQRLGWKTSDEVQELKQWNLDNTETEEILGIKQWRPFDDMIVDTVEQLRAVEGA